MFGFGKKDRYIRELETHNADLRRRVSNLYAEIEALRERMPKQQEVKVPEPSRTAPRRKPVRQSSDLTFSSKTTERTEYIPTPVYAGYSDSGSSHSSCDSGSSGGGDSGGSCGGGGGD